jgi:hypothetical protein
MVWNADLRTINRYSHFKGFVGYVAESRQSAVKVRELARAQAVKAP